MNKKDKRRAKTFYIKPTLQDSLEKKAQLENTSQSNIINQALDFHLDIKNKKIGKKMDKVVIQLQNPIKISVKGDFVEKELIEIR